MKTCVVTGASGLLGRAVVPALAAAGWNVVPLSHRERAGHRAVDLRDPTALAALLDEVAPDAVVHLAAYREPDFCEAHPGETARLNVDPVRLCAERLPASARLLFVSTDYVFDGTTPPYDETSPRHPLSEYGRSKCAAEDVLAGRDNAVVLRVPLLMGAGATLADSGFVAQMLAAVMSDHPQEIDDVLMRYPCWTRDVSGAIAFLLAGGQAGVFHISGPRGGTRYAWTVETARLLGRPHDHLIPSKIVIPRRAGRPVDSHLDDRKLRALGFTTATDPMDVVRAVLAAFA